ncbi:hypothetical protein BGZ97_003347 [Linnemannia gamsii]|uniref:Ferritin/DPS domain-containing protein n=1 Tax=Linnemannia gamsii TaxID=64522 RepID=A0A9P6RJM3_9FUNG|nr:hypothetical protein BGZ97_003347 [Linnemannia gamsii]
MFETQYTELAIAVDEIAERIRALGFPAPGSYREFTKLSSIPEAEGVPAAEEMVRQLVEGHEAVTRTARKFFPVADDAQDEPTADLLTQHAKLERLELRMIVKLTVIMGVLLSAAVAFSKLL